MTRFALLLAVVMVVPTLTTAQTPPPAPIIQQTIEPNLLTARPARGKAQLTQEVVPLDLRFDKVANLPNDVTTKGVTIKGYSRLLTLENKKIGQIVLTGLERGGQVVDLDPQKFTSQFDLVGDQLPDDAALPISGDRKELIAALRQLKKEQPEKEPTQQRQPDRNSQSGRSITNNSFSAANQGGTGDTTTEKKETTKEQKEAYRTTTEGCKVRVDFNKEQAHQQSRVEKLINGAVQDSGTCADSGTAFPLNKNTQSCKPKIEISKRTVTSLFEWFYLDAQAKYQKASDCTADKDKVFKIVEKHGVCPIEIDIKNKKATPQSKLVYEGFNNRVEQVRDCALSGEKPAVVMEQSIQSCKLAHDNAKGITREMGIWTYALDGVIYQATPCTDTGRTFTHKKIYKKNGKDVCQPIIDPKGGGVTLQSRTQITIDGLSRYISDCTPDKGGALQIKSTTEGCTDPAGFRHNIGAGQSLGLRRYYYENPKKIYTTTCQVALDLVYRHKRTAFGWQNNDEDLTALPLTTVSISLNGKPYEIARAIVLPGEKKTPYQLARIESPVSETTYKGCSAIHTRAKVEVYTRPDKTEYKLRTGTAPADKPVNACNKVIRQPVWTFTGKYPDLGTFAAPITQGGGKNAQYYGKKGWAFEQNTKMRLTQRKWVKKQCGTADCSGWQTVYYHPFKSVRYGFFEGARIVQRVDGTRITQQAKKQNQGICGSLDNIVPQEVITAQNVTCPQTYTGKDVYKWNESEGW